MRDSGPKFAEIALPLPLFQNFTYAVEEGLANPVEVGSRVVVPLRSGKEVGVCVGITDVSPLKRKPKAVLESPDAEPAIGAQLLELCKWMADYYIAPLGVVLEGGYDPPALAESTAATLAALGGEGESISAAPEALLTSRAAAGVARHWSL